MDTVQTNPADRTKSRKRKPRLLAVLITLLVVLGGGYFWLAWSWSLLPPEIAPGAAATQEMTASNFRYAAYRYRWADPQAEVDRALAAGDKQWVGVMGVGLIAPGIATTERDNVKVIPHTSDAISSDAHRAYCAAASDFAARYNRTLEQRLGN